MLVSMTLMQGHSGSAEDAIQRRLISTSKQVICIKFATTVGFFVCFLHDLDCDFEDMYIV